MYFYLFICIQYVLCIFRFPIADVTLRYVLLSKENKDWLIDWLLMGQIGLILGVLYQLYSLTCTQVLNQINWVYNFLSTRLTIFTSIHILESCREKQSPVSLQVKWESAVRPLFTHVHILTRTLMLLGFTFLNKGFDLNLIWFDLEKQHFNKM